VLCDATSIEDCTPVQKFDVKKLYKDPPEVLTGTDVHHNRGSRVQGFRHISSLLVLLVHGALLCATARVILHARCATGYMPFSAMRSESAPHDQIDQDHPSRIDRHHPGESVQAQEAAEEVRPDAGSL